MFRPALPVLAALVLLSTPVVLRAADPRAPFIVNYDERVDGAELAMHRTAILSPRAKISNPAAVKAARTRILGYISLGELAAEDAADPVAARVPSLGENREWKSTIPDVTDPVWSEWILDVCAQRVVARGWDGFFLDTLDSARLPEGLGEAAYLAREKAIAGLLVRLRAKFPAMTIVANRGFASLRLAPCAFDGVLAEGVLSTHADGGRYRRVGAEETRELRSELDAWKARGNEVFALDYCDAQPRDAARALYAELTGFGYAAEVATPDLMRGSELAPARRVPCRALGLYGRDVGPGLVEHPSVCLTYSTLRHPLVWHGYNLEYVNVRESGFPENLEDYDLVVIEEFRPPATLDLRVAATSLAKRMRSTKKTVFLGGLSPWRENPSVWDALGAAAGWTGSGDSRTPGSPPKLVLGDKALLVSEDGATPRAREPLPELRAPEGARVLIRQTTTGEGGAVGSDSAFVAPFGGVLLMPWVTEMDAIGRTKARVDFFAYADALLGPSAPVFDTTTRDGARMFFAHVDGDGLHAMSKVELGKLSGEVMRDEIFKKYPIPFTSSVIVAEMRGMTVPRVGKAEIERRQDVARSIYALPNIEVASHSMTHPFAWTQSDPTSRTYARQNLKLLPEFDHPMDYHEETVGSIEYINRNLTGPKKPCKLFLWTGNCLPPAEAIARLDAIGIPNLNGLATSASADNPYLSVIEGACLMYGGVMQVGAPFENDNVYFDINHNGLEGGFSRVIEAFELTGKPRRLLPVDAYWHFFSADTLERLRALRTVLNWAAACPLHPIHASEYASMMRETPNGLVCEDARGGHLVSMPAGCLTLRYPGTVCADMAASSGVLGYRHELGVTYVHTDGSALVRVVLRAGDDDLPKLIFSTRPVDIVRSPKTWRATFGGFSPGKARFAGLMPGADATSSSGVILKVAPDGTLEVDARPGETIALPLR